MQRKTPLMILSATIACLGALWPLWVSAEPRAALSSIFTDHDLVVLGDVQHGVRDRVSFFSSETFFAEMARAGVRHVAVEMPRVLGRQAMGVETESDVEAFARDVINSGRWHFVDPSHPNEEDSVTQTHIASALARQVLFAKRFGLNPIFYDFSNPLGGFHGAPNDPVYRCLSGLSPTAWVRYGLDSSITKQQRDAAIMRERFSHDDKLAAYIAADVQARGGGKLVVIPGFAHAVMPNGLTQQLEKLLASEAAVVAVFTSAAEEQAFPEFLREQAHLLHVDLSRQHDFSYLIDQGTLERRPVKYAVDLNGAADLQIPPVCYQIAKTN